MYPEIAPQRLRLGKQGRLVIPATIRETLKLVEGTELVMHVVQRELRIVKLADAQADAFLAPPRDRLTLAQLVRLDRTGWIE